jgi:hypothetical protein
MKWKKCVIVSFSLLSLLLTVTAEISSSVQDQDKRESAADLIKDILDQRGVESAKAKYEQMKTDRDRYSFEEKEFVSLGYNLLETGELLKATVVLEMAAEAFPGSRLVFMLLAEAYYRSNRTEKSQYAAGRMMAIGKEAVLRDFLENNEEKLVETAVEVIARHIAATGGREAWEDVKTMVLTISRQDTSGNQVRMVRMYKRPFFFRQGLEGSADFSTTDGNRVWRVSGGKWKEATDIPMRFASMDNWFIGYEAAGVSYEFVGLEALNGSPVYRLQRIFKDGFIQDLFFSAHTDLLTEIRSDYIDGRPYMESYYSLWNYREVNRVKIPFVFIRNIGALGPPHGGVVEEVRINVPLDDALFLPPGDKRLAADYK